MARRWALRTVALILGGIGLGICGFILRVTERMGYNESLVRVIILSMIAIIVMYDAQRIGARRIKGCFYWDSLSPVYYSVLVLFFTAIALPAYCLARRRIARNSTRIMPGFK